MNNSVNCWSSTKCITGGLPQQREPRCSTTECCVEFITCTVQRFLVCVKISDASAVLMPFWLRQQVPAPKLPVRRPPRAPLCTGKPPASSGQVLIPYPTRIRHSHMICLVCARSMDVVGLRTEHSSLSNLFFKDLHLLPLSQAFLFELQRYLFASLCAGFGSRTMPPKSKFPSEAALLHRRRTLKLLLLNCPSCITTEDVISHYQGLMGRNTVECVKWFHNGCGVFIGSGILVFDNEASVDEAARLPGPTVMGRQVEVESPLGGGSLDKASELYLWGLPPSAVEEDVRMYYTDKGLTRLKFKMKPDYSSTVGVAFANFESAEAAMKALEMGPPEIRGVKCCVKPSGYQGEKEVCIRGSDKLTDAVLRKQYEAFGADGILSIQWQRGGHDPSSSCRAFVCFKTADMALQALTWGNFMLGDKVMEVFQTGKRFKVLDKEGPGSDAGTDGLPAHTALPDPPWPPMPGMAPDPDFVLHAPAEGFSFFSNFPASGI